MGSLQEALPRPVDADTEREFLEILKRKMEATASMVVEAVRTVQLLYGQEAYEAIRDNQLQKSVAKARERGAGTVDNSVRAFCTALESHCHGSHEWQKLEDSEDRQAYRFTRCMLAEIYRGLDAEDIGLWICDGDGPVAAGFNPRIRFERKQTLMVGDDCCDHVYYLEEDA